MFTEVNRNRRSSLQTFLVALMLFCAGCSSAKQTALTAIPSPSRTAAKTVQIPTVTPTQKPIVEAANPLMKALDALKSVSSVRIHTTRYTGSSAEPGKLLLASDLRYLNGPPEQFQARLDWGQQLVEDTICFGRDQGRDCWSKVGEHPWTYRADMEWIPPLMEQVQQELAASTIISSTSVAESNQLVVAWRRPNPAGVEPVQGYKTGRTWLEADTDLPIREAATELSLDEQPLYYTEVTYSEYDRSITIEAPVVATVTPVPTIPVTPWAPGRDLATHEEELPFAGVMISPDQPGPFPAVVVLHGSEGGIMYSRDVARNLAQKGFVTIALCYFDCPETPEKLENIELETVIQAVDFLKGRPDVRAEAIAVLGISRGAELALIVGALDADVHAVISMMGVLWVMGGFPSGDTAWLYQGQPLPFRNIPVEQINGPVLVLHGERDSVWPVDGSYLIADRLATHRHPFELAVYSDRGHDIGVSPLDAMNRVVDFLREAFR